MVYKFPGFFVKMFSRIVIFASIMNILQADLMTSPEELDTNFVLDQLLRNTVSENCVRYSHIDNVR